MSRIPSWDAFVLRPPLGDAALASVTMARLRAKLPDAADVLAKAVTTEDPYERFLDPNGLTRGARQMLCALVRLCDMTEDPPNAN